MPLRTAPLTRAASACSSPGRTSGEFLWSLASPVGCPASARVETRRRETDQTEVHLFLERVDFGNLNLDAVAKANDATCAAADEVVPRGFEDEEVIHERR